MNQTMVRQKRLLLNISLDNKNAPSFIWKEPFAALLKSKKILFGAA